MHILHKSGGGDLHDDAIGGSHGFIDPSNFENLSTNEAWDSL
jgi:hypothetical protein